MKRVKFLLLALLCSTCCFAQLDESRLTITSGLDGKQQLQATIEANVSSFLKSCNQAVMNGTRPKFKNMFTKSALLSIDAMWKSSAMSCPVSNIKEICLAIPGGYQIRNIPVTMMEAKGEAQEQELVINLTPTGLIDDVLVAIDKNRYKDIINEHESVTDLVRREIIVNFVENYRTAYNRKDLEYINDVFSDDALIITGKVVKRQPAINDMATKALGSETITYQKQTKKEYIDRLKSVFKGNKYINCVFTDVEVIQHPKFDDIYGVTLKQEWNSSRYSDVGYVFLMIDFKDEDNPLIQVRTWQPDKYNGHELSRKEVFGLKNFPVIVRN